MKIVIAVIGLILISGITVRADDQITRVALLLLELEHSTTLSWQKPSWQQERAAWISQVNSAPDVAALGKLVAEFEESLKPEAFEDDWSENAHKGWKFVCRLVGNVPSLGQLISALEQQIKSEAQEDSWTKRREGWIAEMDALVRTTRAEMVNEASKAALLLLELEQSTRLSWQNPSWEQERDTWISQVKGTTGPLTLTHAAFAFEQSLKREALDNEWLELRKDTSISLFSAKNLTEFGSVMINLERHMKFEAQEDSWRQRREQWALEAKAL